MDLSTIKRKLDTGQYQEPWQYVDDIWLMFNNAWLYNRKTSRVYKYCSKLSEVFEQEIDPVMQSLGYCCGRKVRNFSPVIKSLTNSNPKSSDCKLTWNRTLNHLHLWVHSSGMSWFSCAYQLTCISSCPTEFFAKWLKDVTALPQSSQSDEQIQYSSPSLSWFSFPLFLSTIVQKQMMHLLTY